MEKKRKGGSRRSNVALSLVLDVQSVGQSVSQFVCQWSTYISFSFVVLGSTY